MERIKFNLKKCEVNKRRLVLDCDVLIYDFDSSKEIWKNYNFTHDHWLHWENYIQNELIIDGKPLNETDTNSLNPDDKIFRVIEAYKHRFLAYLCGNGDNYIIIDRRYEHNDEFNVYYAGEAYLIKTA